MANEANIVELLGFPPGEPMSATCANGTAISKGAFLVWSDPSTVAAASATSQSPAGIAAMDKEANDGSTKISFYTNCLVDAVAVSGTLNLPIVGEFVELSGANFVRRVTSTLLSNGAFVVGKAQETASAGERIEVRVRL